MENKAHALAAGIFVAALTALLLGLAAWLTRDTGTRDTYEISTRETVTGLQAQAPVRYRGVDVGKVKSIGFDPKAPGNVLVRLSVDREAPITRTTFATLSYQGVTGLAFIQLADEGNSTVRLQPDEAAPPRIPLKPGLLAMVEERGMQLLSKVEGIAGRVDKILSDDNQKRFSAALDNAGAASASIDKLAKRLDTTVERRLDPALAEASTTLRTVQKNVDQVGQAASEFGTTARRLNASGGPIDRLGEGTQALSSAADSLNNATLPRINQMADDVSDTAKALSRTATTLSDNPQSLLYGNGGVRPGPGEPGFAAPAARGGPR